MKKYVKEIDEKTKKCLNIGHGTNIEYYKSIGMIEQEVELGYDGAYYLQGYSPVQPIEERNEDIRKTRKNLYKENSDGLYMDYQEALARGDKTAEEKKIAWLNSKDKIREENPYFDK